MTTVRDIRLPEIPVIDARRGGAPEIARGASGRLHDLLRCARRLVTPPLLGLGDRASRRWLERNCSPYLPEIDAIAALLPGKGAYALNTSFEWCCTSGVGEVQEGASGSFESSIGGSRGWAGMS